MTVFPESRHLWNLIFGPSPLEDDVSRWILQEFVFTNKFVLEQSHGGPCGILAAVQGFMLIDLIFNSRGMKTMDELQTVDSETVSNSLINGLLSILHRASSKKPICLIMWNNESGNFSEFELRNNNQLLSLSLLDFLATLVVHRSIALVVADMDDPSNPLVSRFGHCSQEIVNLVLFGRATSNVFDGEQDLGDGMSLRGVGLDSQVDVGLLSELEALRYVTVGSKLKHPNFPIWILGSTNHYTLLFGFERTSPICIDPFVAAFQAHAFDDGIVAGSDVGKIIADLNLTEEHQTKLNSIVNEDVLLLSDYTEWADSVRTTPVDASSTSLEFFFIDGQKPISVLAVTISENHLNVPEGVIDYGENLCAIIRTNWPQCKHVRAVKLV